MASGGRTSRALRTNLLEIIDRARARYPAVEIVLAGMQAPPNLGERYTDRFSAVFPDVARSKGATLIGFLLDGVAGVPELNQADGIHPTAEGHEIIATTVWGQPRARPSPVGSSLRKADAYSRRHASWQ